MLRFDPPKNATYAEKWPGPGWISCGWQMLDTHRAGRGYSTIARDLGCNKGNLTLWRNGKTPSPNLIEKLEKLANVPPIAWQWWICVDPIKAAESRAPQYEPRYDEQGYAVDFVNAVREAVAALPDAAMIERRILERYKARLAERELYMKRSRQFPGCFNTFR